MNSIGNALFSTPQQRVLTLLFGKPDKWFEVKNVMARTGLDETVVREELSRLESGQLIVTRRMNDRDEVLANPDCPVLTSLQSLVVSSFGVADRIREALAPLTPEIQLAFVFGSVARGDQHARSDVDLMVVSDTLSFVDVGPALWETEYALDRPVNSVIYPAADFSARYRMRHSFLANVLRHPKLFIVGASDDIERIGKSGQDQSAQRRAVDT